MAPNKNEAVIKTKNEAVIKTNDKARDLKKSHESERAMKSVITDVRTLEELDPSDEQTHVVIGAAMTALADLGKPDISPSHKRPAKGTRRVR